MKVGNNCVISNDEPCGCAGILLARFARINELGHCCEHNGDATVPCIRRYSYLQFIIQGLSPCLGSPFESYYNSVLCYLRHLCIIIDVNFIDETDVGRS